VLQAIRQECRGIVYCKYSTGSGIDRKSRRMREAKQVANWVLILFRWLIAMPDRAAVGLTAWTVVADRAGVNLRAFYAARWGSFESRSPGLDWPLLRSIRWMTFCLGQGWTIAPRGLLPALASRSNGRPSRRRGYPVPRRACRGAAGLIRGDHFLSGCERVPGRAVHHSACPSLGLSVTGRSGSYDRLLDTGNRRRTLAGGS
jgi:hypothetical protein